MVKYMCMNIDKQVENIVFDFNGTIIDDVDLCFNLLNKLLTLQNHKTVSKETYLEIFGFPIIDYYKKAGFEFDNGKDDFKKLSIIFTNDYYSQFNTIKMFDDVINTLEYLNKKYNLYILSATRQDLLDTAVNNLKITKYFKGIIGIKDIYGHSKLDIGREYFKSHNIDTTKTVFVGDTIHDDEVAKNLNGISILIARGHQNKNILLKAKPFMIFDNLTDLEKIL